MYNGSFDLSNESKPIRDIAYDRLKHAIITGELPAGSRIVETTYAEQLHISRTPLREALSATGWWNMCCAAAWWCALSRSTISRRFSPSATP